MSDDNRKGKDLLSISPLMVENSATHRRILVFRAWASPSAEVARDSDSSMDSLSFRVSLYRGCFSSAADFSSSAVRSRDRSSSAFSRDTSSRSYSAFTLASVTAIYVGSAFRMSERVRHRFRNRSWIINMLRHLSRTSIGYVGAQ